MSMISEGWYSQVSSRYLINKVQLICMFDILQRIISKKSTLKYVYIAAKMLLDVRSKRHNFYKIPFDNRLYFPCKANIHEAVLLQKLC